MTERIARLMHFQWERMHHDARIALPDDLQLTVTVATPSKADEYQVKILAIVD